MKIIEDQQIKFEKSHFGNYGANFNLYEVIEWQPPKLELIFKDEGQTISVFLLPAEEENVGVGLLLRNYKKEIEENLLGKTWHQILDYDFKFGRARRL